ncbi:MAG: thymidine phosphorylase [Planctomycetes bacterium]|nr:thymidine phosphorylase [Planctomycetota bacterium]
MATRFTEVIRRKRDGLALTAEEVRDFVRGLTDGLVRDAELGAFLMAATCCGMTPAEMAALAAAVRDSGTVLDLSHLDGPRVDKRSTGGVGDKTSLLLAPWVAAAGVFVPMMSGPGLGHSGDTTEKLDAIPGYKTELPTSEFLRVVRECGYSIIKTPDTIAPADRRMNCARTQTGTLNSIPLITASILSRKLAGGIDSLVVDVKTGSGALLARRAQAEELMRGLVEAGNLVGMRVAAVLSSMASPLGRMVGYALEIRETVESLRNEGPPDVTELTRLLAVEMLVLAGRSEPRAKLGALLDSLLESGSVAETWQRNVELQGGDPRVLDDPALLPRARHRAEVVSRETGHVLEIDARAIGSSAKRLALRPGENEQIVDPSAGVELQVAIGDLVERGQPVAVLHSNYLEQIETETAEVAAAIRFGNSAPQIVSRVLRRHE